MKRIFGKDFCIWLVSPQDGTVRKLRLTSGKIALALILFLFFLGSFAFVAGDYTRVQVLRAKHYFNFKRLSNERGSLVSHNQDLRSKVNTLTQEQRRVLSYEQEVRKRLYELSSVLESASELGIHPYERSAEDRSAIGGAETECGNGENCENSEGAGYEPSSFGVQFPEEDLIGQLERSIELVKTIPLGLPAHGFMSSPYGVRRSPFTGRWRRHQGVDFGLPHGSSIVATADGVVKSVRRNSTYGLKIDIEHGDRVYTRFAHLSKALVKTGQEVCRGQEIGLVGSSGRSTGPHLHYEVRVDGKAIDPEVLFVLSQRIKRSFPA